MSTWLGHSFTHGTAVKGCVHTPFSKWLSASALIRSAKARPTRPAWNPMAQSADLYSVSHTMMTWSTMPSTCSPRKIDSKLSVRRVSPMRHGVHLPQL